MFPVPPRQHVGPPRVAQYPIPVAMVADGHGVAPGRSEAVPSANRAGTESCRSTSQSATAAPLWHVTLAARALLSGPEGGPAQAGGPLERSGGRTGGCDQRALWPCCRTAPAPPACSIVCGAASPRAPCRRWRPNFAAAVRAAARAGRSSTARRAAGIRASAPRGVPWAASRRHAGRRRTA